MSHERLLGHDDAIILFPNTIEESESRVDLSLESRDRTSFIMNFEYRQHTPAVSMTSVVDNGTT